MKNGAEDSNVIPLNQNQARAEDAQRRIRAGVERLQQSGELPADVTSRVRRLVKEAHTSVQTLYRHRNLWHPEHWQLDPSTEPVIAEAESDSSDEAAKSPDPEKSSESRQSRQLHTLEENIKCRVDFNHGCMTDPLTREASIGTVLEFRMQGWQENQLNESFLEKPYE